MKIIADIFNKTVIIDDEVVFIDNWNDIKIPDGVRTIMYDTEVKSGVLIWMNETMPNWAITEASYTNIVAQFENKYRLDKARQETARIEAIRIEGERVAAIRLAEAQKTLDEVREKAETTARLAAIEAKLGIVRTSDEQREPL